MQPIVVPVVGMTTPRWTPLYASPRIVNPGLGQSWIHSELGQTSASGKLSIIDSPFVALVTDVAAGTSMGMLAYYFSQAKSAWSNVFWSFTAVFFLKAIVDINRLGGR